MAAGAGCGDGDGCGDGCGAGAGCGTGVDGRVGRGFGCGLGCGCGCGGALPGAGGAATGFVISAAGPGEPSAIGTNGFVVGLARLDGNDEGTARCFVAGSATADDDGWLTSSA